MTPQDTYLDLRLLTPKKQQHIKALMKSQPTTDRVKSLNSSLMRGYYFLFCGEDGTWDLSMPVREIYAKKELTYPSLLNLLAPEAATVHNPEPELQHQKPLAAYEKSCTALVNAFAKKHKMTFQFWVGGRVGEVAVFPSQCIALADIATDLRLNAPAGALSDWQMDHDGGSDGTTYEYYLKKEIFQQNSPAK